MTTKVTELTHDDLVNILSTGLYGCDYLSAEYSTEDYNKIPEDMRMGDCYEDKLADILLNNGTIKITDYWAEGEVYSCLGKVDDENDESSNVTYTLYLEDFIRACTKGMKYATNLLVNEDGDYYDGNSLIQIAMFGELIYG